MVAQNRYYCKNRNFMSRLAPFEYVIIKIPFAMYEYRSGSESIKQ